LRDHLTPGRGRLGHGGNLGRIEKQHRIARFQLHCDLIDIAVLAAEAGRQRQRHRPCAGVDRAAEQGGELRPGLGDDRHPVARLDPVRDQAAGAVQRVAAQLRVGIGPHQPPAGIVEVQTFFTPRRVIERLAEGSEIGKAPGQAVVVDGGDRGAGWCRCERFVVGHDREKPVRAGLRRSSAAHREPCHRSRLRGQVARSSPLRRDHG
jgi:hypothetical protein